MQGQLVAELLCLLPVGQHLVNISEMTDDVIHNVTLCSIPPNCVGTKLTTRVLQLPLSWTGGTWP